MNRAIFHVVAMVMLLSQATLAVAQQKATETVRVLQLSDSDTDRYICCIGIEVPSSLTQKVNILTISEQNLGIDTVPFEKGFTATTSNHAYVLRRTKFGDAVEKYYVYVKRKKDLSSIVVRIEDRRYPIDCSVAIEPSEITTKKRTEYGPFKDFYTAKQFSWSDELKRKLAYASVRISTPFAQGSGTMVEVPDELKAFVANDEVLVATAAHVTPAALRSNTVWIETFNYDHDWKPTVDRKFKAEILLSFNLSNYPDIAFLKFSPGDYKPVRAHFASRRRWFSRKCKYMAIGCPNGKLPRIQMVDLLQASTEDIGSVVFAGQHSIVGESGGGLFDPDGALIAIRARTSEKSSQFQVGNGLLDAPEEGEGVRNTHTSIFWHVSSSETEWINSIRENALNSFEDSVRYLNESDKTTLRRAFIEALDKRFE